MGLEIAEQSGWTMPDAIFYPMGGGLGAIAIYKAFDELLRLGWVEGRMPRLYVTHYAGCAPVVKAFEAGRAECEPWGRIESPPGGLKSPNPPAADRARSHARHCGAALAVTTPESLAAVDGSHAKKAFRCPKARRRWWAAQGSHNEVDQANRTNRSGEHRSGLNRSPPSTPRFPR